MVPTPKVLKVLPKINMLKVRGHQDSQDETTHQRMTCPLSLQVIVLYQEVGGKQKIGTRPATAVQATVVWRKQGEENPAGLEKLLHVL